MEPNGSPNPDETVNTQPTTPGEITVQSAPPALPPLEIGVTDQNAIVAVDTPPLPTTTSSPETTSPPSPPSSEPVSSSPPEGVYGDIVGEDGSNRSVTPDINGGESPTTSTTTTVAAMPPVTHSGETEVSVNQKEPLLPATGAEEIHNTVGIAALFAAGGAALTKLSRWHKKKS